MEDKKGITIEDFKKQPFKEKLHTILLLIIGLVVFPFYYAYMGLKLLINKIKGAKKNGR